MEFCEQIKKFAELELEREHKQIVEAIRNQTPEERLRIVGNVVLGIVNIHLQLDQLESELNQHENTYECLREVYADEGIDIDEIYIQLIPEDEEFDSET